ncbi:hypothetical protein [Streptomyces niveus]|uniref:hypothetical protein n=1 Tax=Streptomyces niveus TaxID=193462 RepID=UPI00386791F1
MPSRFEYERAIRHSELPPLSRLLALTVATWADARTGVIPARLMPSLTTLEDATGMARASVRTHLDKLEAGAWLLRDRPSVAAARSEKARTHYKIRIPKGAAVSDSDGIELGQDTTNARAGAALDVDELGQELPQAGAGAALALGQEMTTTRAGAALKSSFSSSSSVEYQLQKQPAPRTPAAADDDALRTVQPLIDEMGRRDMRVSWQLQTADWRTLATLVRTRSVPVLVDHAERVWRSSKNAPYSVRYFLPGWTSLPETPINSTPSLRAVPGRSGPPTAAENYLEGMARIAAELRAAEEAAERNAQ